MTSTWVIARKELLDLRRNRFLLAVLGFVLVAVIVSVVVAATQFRVKLDAYTAYVAALQAAGGSASAPAPQLFPLQLMRGSVEYLEILGALFAIVMGYSSISKEKDRATLQLLYSRPIGRFAVPVGKLVALATAWAVAVIVVIGAVMATLAVVGHATFTGLDLARLGAAGVATWIYLVMWSAISLGLTAASRRTSTALIVALVLWLAVVLIVPQVGDTMDPDNAVPGGLFKSLQIAKADEIGVLSHFSAYDTVRNGMENLSLTKHYERFSFAFLGIKDQFNQQPLTVVWTGVWNNATSLLLACALAVALALLATTRTRLMRRTR